MKLHEFLEAVPEASIVVDADRRILQVNARAESLLDRRRQELVGSPLGELLPGCPDVRCGWAADSRLRVRWKDGREVAVAVSHGELEAGRDLLVVRPVAEAEHGPRDTDIWSNEARLRALLESTRAIPWEASAKTWEFTYVGPQAVELLGYPIERWYERDFWASHIHPDDREGAVAYCAEASRQFKDYDFEYRMIDASGNAVWLHDVVSVGSVNGVPEFLRGFMIDITARKLAEARLRDLSGRLIHAQEEERRRIARELHDDLSQRLGLLSLELDRLGQGPGEKANLGARIRALKTLANDLSSDLHRLSYELHPSMINHLGLVAAVRSHCRELSRQQRIEIEFTDHEVPRDLPEEVSLCLYRITQETLRNVVRHSGARRARVELIGARQGRNRRIRLRVCDAGAGFDPDLPRNGLGLVSMEERLRLVGGEMTIDSGPNKGTCIDVWVPVVS